MLKKFFSDYFPYFSLKKISLYKDLILNQTYSTLSFLVNVLVSFFTIKLVTTYITPENFGLYQYVLSVSTLCGISTISGINKTILGYVTKGYHGTVKKTTILSCKLSLIGILILIGFGLYSMFIKIDYVESGLFFVSAIFFIPFRIFPRYQSILAGLNKFKDKFVLQSVFVFGTLLCSFIVLVIFKKDILVFGITQIIFQSFCLSIFFVYTYKKLLNKKIDNEYFNHSFIITLIGLGSEIILPGIQIYLNYALGPSFLALYAIANKMTSGIGGAIKSIINPIIIKLGEKNKLDHRAAIFRLIPFLLFFGIIIYVIIFIAIDLVGPFLVNKQYSESLYYAKLLSLVIIFSPLYAVLRGNMLFEKNNKGFASSVYVHQGFQLVGYLIFVSKFGIPAIGVVNFFASATAVTIMLLSIKSIKI